MSSLKYILIKNRQLFRGLNYITNSKRFICSTEDDSRISVSIFKLFSNFFFFKNFKFPERSRSWNLRK